jgi:hypothetical protein
MQLAVLTRVSARQAGAKTKAEAIDITKLQRG